MLGCWFCSQHSLPAGNDSGDHDSSWFCTRTFRSDRVSGMTIRLPVFLTPDGNGGSIRGKVLRSAGLPKFIPRLPKVPRPGGTTTPTRTGQGFGSEVLTPLLCFGLRLFGEEFHVPVEVVCPLPLQIK